MPYNQVKKELEKLKQMRNQTPVKKVLGAVVTQQMKDKQQDAVIDQALVVFETMANNIKELTDKINEK